MADEQEQYAALGEDEETVSQLGDSSDVLEVEEETPMKEEKEEADGDDSSSKLSPAEEAQAAAVAAAAAGKAKPPPTVPLHPLLKRPTITVTLSEPAGLIKEADIVYPIQLNVGSRFQHILIKTFAEHRTVAEEIAAGHPTIIPPPFPQAKIFTNMLRNIEARTERGEEIRMYYETIMNKPGYLKSEHAHKAFGISDDQVVMLRRAGRRLWRCLQQEKQLKALDEAKKLVEEEAMLRKSAQALLELDGHYKKSQAFRRVDGERLLLLEEEVTLRLVRPTITLIGPMMNVLDSSDRAWFSLRKLDSSRWNKWIEWCLVDQKGYPMLVYKLDYSGAVMVGQQMHVFRVSMRDDEESESIEGSEAPSDKTFEEKRDGADTVYNAKQLRKEDKLLLHHLATVSCSYGMSTIQLLDLEENAPWMAMPKNSAVSAPEFSLMAVPKAPTPDKGTDEPQFTELHFYSQKKDEVTEEIEPGERKASFYKVTSGWRPTFDIILRRHNDVLFYLALSISYALMMEQDKTISYAGAAVVV